VKGCWKHFANEVKKGDEKLNFADGFFDGKPQLQEETESSKNKPGKIFMNIKRGKVFYELSNTIHYLS